MMMACEEQKIRKSFVASFVQASFEFKSHKTLLLLISSTLLQSDLPQSPL
jgi:hypothetical protein